MSGSPGSDYYWGGPKDQIKILFRQSNNNRFKVIGLIEMFSKREEGADKEDDRDSEDSRKGCQQREEVS